MPLETDDRDEVPAGPEEALVGLGGRMGFGEYDEDEAPSAVDEAGGVPAGVDETGEEPAGPDVLLVGEGGRMGFGDEALTGSEVAGEADEESAEPDTLPV